MNASVFLECLMATGFTTGTQVLGLYSFSSGDNNFVFNQVFPTSFNYYSGYPFASALPLVFEGAGVQTNGAFHTSQAYQIANAYNQDFGLLLLLNNSGCLNTGNNNYLLVSTTSGLQNGNSGIILGLTPSNRLYIEVTGGYSLTAPAEVDVMDFAFLSVQQGQFVNFGSFSLKNNIFYRQTYDYGTSGITVQNLFIGGTLNYSSNLTGYSGVMSEAYLFNSNISDTSFLPCIDCIFATGYYYNTTTGVFNEMQITGSFWSGVSGISITGQNVVSGNYPKLGGSGTIYYDITLSGLVGFYTGLFSQSASIPYTGVTSSIAFLYNTNEILSGLISNLYFGVSLSSGDIVEIYTYVSPQIVGQSLSYNGQFPSSTQLVQLYSNGLAETSGVDYNLLYNNYVRGFDAEDILLYDVISNAITMPYYTGYVLTGIPGAYYTLITGISGINMNQFVYDIYLNGQKMASGVNYTYASPNLLVSGNDLADINDLSDTPELKLITQFPGLMRTFYEVTGGEQGIGLITGYTEEVWLNGLRQTKNIDYFLVNTCPSCTGFYYPPNFDFLLYSSLNDNIDLFNIPVP